MVANEFRIGVLGVVANEFRIGFLDWCAGIGVQDVCKHCLRQLSIAL